MENALDDKLMPICWIYILQDSRTRKYRIGYVFGTIEKISALQTDRMKLVYLRAFDNVADAMGYKLFLEKISVASLRRIIRQQNPEMNDIWDTKEI